jgi:AcrR family transcriptional regulator
MSRTVGSYGPKTLDAIRRAGLRLIYEHGYEGMNLRQLAGEVGIKQGSLYNHINSKQELLFDLVKHHMEHVLQELDAALAGIDDPVDRLRAFIAFHVNYHMVRKKEIFVANFELRSLDSDNYATIVEMRRTYEKRLSDILEKGIALGAFVCGDVRVATYGILAMLTGVCTWYRSNGRLSRDDIIDTYIRLVLRGLQPEIKGRVGEFASQEPENSGRMYCTH